MMPMSDGMSDTTRAIYRRSPLHLTKGSWLDVPESVSVTSAAQRADINRAVHLIKGKVFDAPRGASRSCSDFSLRWQDSSDLGLPPSSGSQVEAGASDLSVGRSAVCLARALSWPFSSHLFEAGLSQQPDAMALQAIAGTARPSRLLESHQGSRSARAQVHRPPSTATVAAVTATRRYVVAASAGLAMSRRRLENSRSTVARRAQELRRDGSPNREVLLEDILTFSSIFMVVWVFVFPGSAWVGSSAQYDGWLRNIFEMFFSDLGPSSLLLKYNRFGSLLEWMHAVPGAVWCLLAPLQLVPECRAWLGEKHEDAGRLMLSAAAVLMVGFLLIDANHLTADRVDFATGGSLADAADAWSTSVAAWLPPFNQGGMYVIAAWFVYTGIQTFRTGTAHAADHGSWALRHAAAGLWVAAQRPMFAAVRVAQGLLGFGGSLAEADAFYCSAYVVTAAYIAFAEVAIRGRTNSTAAARSERENDVTRLVMLVWTTAGRDCVRESLSSAEGGGKMSRRRFSRNGASSLVLSTTERMDMAQRLSFRKEGLLGRSCAGKPPSMPASHGDVPDDLQVGRNEVLCSVDWIYVRCSC
ncbi:rckA [Symbiodinium sp. CCMP2456]|nr:rckA [Symbiodinium sp. CCMP2456]